MDKMCQCATSITQLSSPNLPKSDLRDSLVQLNTQWKTMLLMVQLFKQPSSIIVTTSLWIDREYYIQTRAFKMKFGIQLTHQSRWCPHACRGVRMPRACWYSPSCKVSREWEVPGPVITVTPALPLLQCSTQSCLRLSLKCTQLQCNLRLL